MTGMLDADMHDRDTHDELRMLRARAYGPHADIDRDPAALRRLAELEARDRAGAPSYPPPAPDRAPGEAAAPGPAPAPDVSPGAALDDSTPEPSADAPPPAASRAARLLASTRTLIRRPLVIFATWAVSLVVVAAVAAGVTAALARPVSQVTGKGPVTTLGVTADDGSAAQVFGDDDALRFDDLYGLTVLATSAWSYTGGDTCLVVVGTQALSRSAAGSNQGIEGPISNGCGAGGFPATAQMRVTEAFPDALRARFADGTALQFVLHGDRVDVYTDAR